MATNSGCDVTLLDLPLAGLQIAAKRATANAIAGICRITCADAAKMPFSDASFDALSHSDLLCCLKQKRAVLQSCNRVTRRGGRMAFTVISLAANLGSEELKRALAASPEFVESESDYLTLLSQTGWRLLESQDLSLDYAASTRRQLKAMKKNQQSLVAVIGESDYADRYKKHTSKVLALHDGVLRRELFVVTPA